MKYTLLFLLTFLLFSNSCKQNRNPNIDLVVNAELSFAKMAYEKSVRTAFLEFLTDEAVMFRPRIANGKEIYTAAPPSKDKLIWRPAFADIANSLDLGYSTGPWKYLAEGADEEKALFGHYVTLWQQQNDGSLKVVFDAGISHEGVSKPIEDTQVEYAQMVPAKKNEKTLSDPDSNMLLELDKAFSSIANEKGLEAAYKKYATKHIRVNRPGKLPYQGIKEVKIFAEKNIREARFKTVATQISKAGDLGYTLGTFMLINDKEIFFNHSYLHIWKKQKDGAWKLVLDLVTSPYN